MTAACEPPGLTFAISVTCRCRFKRSIAEGPVPSSVCTRFDRFVHPTFDDCTKRFCKASGLVRACPVARTRTSYWSVPSLKVETFCPAMSTLRACAMSPTRTPRSAARARSICTRTSGLPTMSVESGSTTSGMVFIFARSCCEYSVSFCKSGPPMTYCMSAFRLPPPEIAATGWTLVRSSGYCFRYFPRISVRARTIRSICETLRSLRSASLT